MKFVSCRPLVSLFVYCGVAVLVIVNEKSTTTADDIGKERSSCLARTVAKLRAEQTKLKAEQTKLKAEHKAEQAKLKAEQAKLKAEQTKLKAEQAKLRAELASTKDQLATAVGRIDKLQCPKSNNSKFSNL